LGRLAILTIATQRRSRSRTGCNRWTCRQLLEQDLLDHLQPADLVADDQPEHQR